MEATAIAFHGLEIKRELYHAEQCLAYSNFSVNMFPSVYVPLSESSWGKQTDIFSVGTLLGSLVCY